MKLYTVNMYDLSFQYGRQGVVAVAKISFYFAHLYTFPTEIYI